MEWFSPDYPGLLIIQTPIGAWKGGSDSQTTSRSAEKEKNERKKERKNVERLQLQPTNTAGLGCWTNRFGRGFCLLAA